MNSQVNSYVLGCTVMVYALKKGDVASLRNLQQVWNFSNSVLWATKFYSTLDSKGMAIKLIGNEY